MEEFLQHIHISFERAEAQLEMEWHEEANQKCEKEEQPPSSKEEHQSPASAAAASGSAGIARAPDTLVKAAEAASAEEKWEPPSDDEVEDVRRTLRPGVDKHKDEGGWASRRELRSKGHG